MQLYDWYGYNKKLFFLINSYINSPQNRYCALFLKYLSEFFSVYYTITYYFIYITYMYFYVKKYKLHSNNVIIQNTSCWNNIMLAVRVSLYYFVFLVTYTVIKFGFGMPRPWCSLDFDSYQSLVSNFTVPCFSSFPSSHAGVSLLILYCIWGHVNIAIKLLGVFIVIMCSISRISLAMHYPADVFYGLLFIIPVIIVGKYILQRYKKFTMHYIELLYQKI